MLGKVKHNFKAPNLIWIATHNYALLKLCLQMDDTRYYKEGVKRALFRTKSTSVSSQMDHPILIISFHLPRSEQHVLTFHNLFNTSFPARALGPKKTDAPKLISQSGRVFGQALASLRLPSMILATFLALSKHPSWLGDLRRRCAGALSLMTKSCGCPVVQQQHMLHLCARHTFGMINPPLQPSAQHFICLHVSHM
jgi:hypothetical protein